MSFGSAVSIDLDQGVSAVQHVGRAAIPAPASAAPSTTTTTAPPPPPTTTATTAPPPPPPPPPPPTEKPHWQSTPEEAIRRWFGDVYDRALRIARCESGLNPSARSAGGGNHGLFQINNVHRAAFERVTGQPWADGVYNAHWNAMFARTLYNSSGWRPWGCR